jgi:hypothetical protein
MNEDFLDFLEAIASKDDVDGMLYDPIDIGTDLCA